MPGTQREPNPDVDDFGAYKETGVDEDVERPSGDSAQNIEQKRDEDVIPVPPDVKDRQPIEDPPHGSDAPVGDVDDSPKQIV
jgi:hypothetical protein